VTAFSEPPPDRRTQPRLNLDQPVVVTMLGDNPFCLPGRVVNVSGRGMRIAIPSPLPDGAAVRVDWENSLVLGEVRYCAKEGSWYMLGIEMEHGLPDLASLARLAERISEQVSSPAPAMGPLRKS
jgi:hypothetical protein